jgi:hypothetical protein
VTGRWPRKGLEVLRFVAVCLNVGLREVGSGSRSPAESQKPRADIEVSESGMPRSWMGLEGVSVGLSSAVDTVCAVTR